MYDLIVIGGGPAGLTATIYAVRKRLNVLLVTEDLGGKTNFHPPLPPSFEHAHDYQVVRGAEIIDKFKRELEYLDFMRLMDGVTTVERAQGKNFSVRIKTGETLLAKAVIVATGVSAQRLNIPGKSDYRGRGIYYSAWSYAPHFVDRRVAVVGGGDLAMRAAAELALVAKHTYVVMPTCQALDSPIGEKLAAAKNVSLLKSYHPTAVRGGQYAEALRVRGPEDREQELNTDGIFVEQALLPHSHMVATLVDLDVAGRIKIDAHNCTSVPGIFAAGDVTDTYAEQVLVAIGEGAKAALSAYEYLLPTL